MFEKAKAGDGLFAGASPNATFLFGFVSGLALVTAIGFFVLLFQRGGLTLSEGAGTPPAVTGGAVAAAPATPPADAAAPTVLSLAPVTDSDHARGPANAAITIVEFSDTECPFCKRFHETMRDVMTNYDGKVRWVYRHFPLRSLHSKAAREAEATECAAELGGNDKFWAYVDRLYATTPSNDGLADAELPRIATAVGLNEKKFTECLNSGKYAEKVRQHESDALAAGGQGTPYSVLIAPDGQKIPISGAVPFAEVETLLQRYVQ